jgi:hypothetical protein
MANITPVQALGSGYALITHNQVDGLFIPLANVTGLSSAEANATTGDGRKVIAGLIERIYENIQALASNARPVHLTIAKGQPTGVAINQVNQTFTVTIRYNTAFSQIVEVADEPV